ncbi:AsmA family protein [Candidatus Pelagibacter bacterium]|nr:AsmA family protein [Candidatus Pelagibacter bacterium]
MKKIVKIFNNFIKRTIFKVENKTNDKFHVSNFSKYIIAVIVVLFIYIFYLSIPLLYDKNWVQNKILTKLSDEFNINLSNSFDISYRILPKPHYLIKDTKTASAEIKKLNVYISQNNFFNKDSIRISEVVIEEANFSLLKDNFKTLFKDSENKFSKKKIKIKDSNIFFKDNLNEIISIIKISNAFLFFDEKFLFNLFDLKGEIFNIPFELNFQNIVNSQKKIIIKVPDLKLKIINEFFKKDEDFSSGINNISFLSSSINTKYNIKDQIVIFQSEGSRVFNSKINYNGQLSINPFDLNLKINLYNYKISNLFTPNSIINEFIKSGLLFNENISVHTLVNIESTKKDEIFNKAKLDLRVLNGKISFDNSMFINNNIGLIEVSNSNLFLENNKLILTSNLSIDIKDIDGLFSFLNTSKKSRKDIKNIKLNIIYDFLGNEISFKNIKIDDNKVSDQFYNIAEGFNDNNSNNLTKSRRLLNELIGIYEG